MRLRQQKASILLFLLTVCAPALVAQDGLRGALSRISSAMRSVTGFAPQIAAADFDNDQKPDGAILIDNGMLNGKRSFRIELHVTAAQNKTLTFSTAETGLGISALDVNQDGAPDIIVENVLTHERLRVYVNDRHGAFRDAPIEDYPPPDPSSPYWRALLTEGLPTFCPPGTRGFETAGPHRMRRPHADAGWRLNVGREAVLVQSAARAAGASRAPPTLLSL